MAKCYDYEFDKDLLEMDEEFFDSMFGGDLEFNDSDIEFETDSVYKKTDDIYDEDIYNEEKTSYEDEPYDIKNHKLLSHEETIDLLKKAQAGEKDAVEILVERNIRLIKSIARSFPANTIISKNDLIQEGSIGLVKAINRFDVKKGYKFSTYATWWIRQAMQRALADNGKSIKIPVYLQEELLRIKKVQKSLEQKLNRMPTPKEIAEELKINCEHYYSIINHDFFENLESAIDFIDERKEIELIIMEDLGFNSEAELILKRIIDYMFKKHKRPSFEEINKKVNLDAKQIKKYLEIDLSSNVASLNVPASDDFDTNYGDNIASEENVEGDVNDKLITEGLLKALDEVFGTGKHSKEYYISTHNKEGCKNYDPLGEKFIPKNELIKYRYGIGGYKKETLEQLGERYHVSRERIRQIEKKVLGLEYNKDGSKKISKDSQILQRKIKEYCGLEISDFY